MNDLKESRLLMPWEVARLLHCSTYTVRLLAESGRLPAVRTPGGLLGPGHRRYREQDVQAFIDQQQEAL